MPMIDRTESADPAHVLLVEPSPEAGDAIRDGLSSRGSEMIFSAAEDGSEALDVLHQRGEYADAPRPCLVILRFDLPESGPDGAAVLEALAEETTLSRIPVIVTATSPSDDAVREAYQLGANAVVPTPDDPDALVETMELVAEFWIATARLPNRADRL